MHVGVTQQEGDRQARYSDSATFCPHSGERTALATLGMPRTPPPTTTATKGPPYGI